MRTVRAHNISRLIGQLCIEANTILRSDVLKALKEAHSLEKDERCKKVLKILLENARIAKATGLPICQDTGMVLVFVELGLDVRITGGELYAAVNVGIRDAYRRSYFRKSVVVSPFVRKNTRDNTPGLVHLVLTPGDRFDVTVLIKGFGCENKSRVKMLRPTAQIDEVEDFVLNVVKEAGAAACPPFVVGVGVGGTLDWAALLSKQALLVPLDRPNPKKRLAKLEADLLTKINRLKIGPMGFGGKTTALGVKVLASPTHIAGMPVAVNINCHALRSARGMV